MQLVIAPTTVTDSKGRFVDGLTPADLVLYDNNVPQPIHLDWSAYPISLVVAVQTSANSGAALAKLGASGILLSDLVAADKGETAVISFSDEVKVRRDFTTDPDLVTRALRSLRMDGDDAHVQDAIHQAMTMLAGRAPERRRIVLVIGEKRDRSSRTRLADLAEEVQRNNAAVYWLTWSPFLEPFTDRPKTDEDGKPIPVDLGPGGYAYAIGELARLRKPDLSSLLTAATGGRRVAFVRKGALDEAVQAVGAEIHRQYVVTFEAKGGAPGEFHSLRAEVKGRPELRVATRAGYWTLP